MSRPGIDYQAVANAAIQLQAQHHHPTVDRVREILGTGSKTTIARLLKEWRLNAEKIVQSDDIPEELLSILKGLWERLKMEAEGLIKSHQEKADHLLQEEKNKLFDEKKQRAELEQQLQHMQQKLNEETSLSRRLAQSLEAEKHTTTALSERNEQIVRQSKDHKAEIERLHQLLAHVQHNLEYYQLSIQKLRDEQALNAEKQKNTYEKKIHSLTQSLTEEIHQKNKCLQKYNQLENELKHSIQQYHSIKNDHLHLQKELDENKDKTSTLKQQNENLKQLNQAYEQRANKQNQLLMNAEKKLAIYSHEMTLLRKSNQEDQGKINTLMAEKLALIKEKFQLDGQLKQLEKMTKEASGVVNQI